MYIGDIRVLKTRQGEINQFYKLMDSLYERVGGYRHLSTCTGKLEWPKRGMYFFFETGERRKKKNELRVIRVGTHAVIKGSQTSLWDRLRTHRGTKRGKRVGGGNHRGSIFRLHVGTAILKKEQLEKKYKAWGNGSSASSDIRNQEHPIEQKVSAYIGNMPFLWVKVDDPPDKKSSRAYLEKNSIALLSNFNRTINNKVDIASPDWLGRHCKHPLVILSGLWNVKHVTESVMDHNFLDVLETKIAEMD